MESVRGRSYSIFWRNFYCTAEVSLIFEEPKICIWFMNCDTSVRWYVFRVPYNRELKSKNEIGTAACGVIYSYDLCLYRKERTTGTNLEASYQQSDFHSFFAVFLSEFKQQVDNFTPIKYMMDRETSTPLVVRDMDMDNFIQGNQDHERGVGISEESRFKDLKIGCRVRVTDGPFKDTEGHIVKIKKDKRVLVSIPGVAMVATAFIPSFR